MTKEQIKKWIHLTGLEQVRPQYGIEGLTVNEAILWLRELLRVLEKRVEYTELEEYRERSAGG